MFDLLDGPVRELVVALFSALGYAGVVALTTLESVVIPLPSELVLPFAGFLVADPRAIEPLTGARWDPLLLILAGDLGSVTGALVAYAIGARGGRPFLARYGRYLLLVPEDLARAEAFFARYGNRAALFGRVVPLVRSLVSFTAGIARMPLGPFVLYTAIGSLPYVAVMVGLGLAAGAAWGEVEAILRPIEGVVTVLVGLAAAALIVALVRRHRRAGRSPGA